MKKKMLFMAALAGAVTLASCVKDDESGSVTAIRNAKANELNSKATLNEANAVLAAAQAAYVAAQTATEQANTAFVQANAKIQAAEASLKEDALADELAAIKARYQNTAADEAGKAAQELRDMAIDAQTDLATAIGIYQTKLGTYTASQAAYVAAKVALETAKINPDYAKEQAALAIKAEENTIKENQLLIDALKNAEYSSMTDAELAATQAAKTVEKAQAVNDFNSSEEVANLLKASKDFMDARDDYNDSKAAITALNTLALTTYNTLKPATAATYDVVDVDGAAIDLYPAETEDFWDFKTYVYDAAVGTDDFDYTYISAGLGTNYNSTTPYSTDHFRLNDANNTELANLLATEVETQTKNYNEAVDLLGTETDKPDATAKLPINNNGLTKYAIYNGAKAELDEAKDSLDKVQAKYDAELAKLVQAYKDLAAAYAMAATETTKADKIKAAKKDIGDELVKIYGEWTPAVPLAPDASNIDAYVFNGATTFAAEFEGAGADQSYTNIKNVIVANAITGRGVGADPVTLDQEFTAQMGVVTAKQGAYDTAEAGVAGQKDTVAGYKTDKEKAESDKAAFEAAIAAVDVNGVNEAADKLADLMDAWDAARKAELDAEDNINNLKAEITALNLYQTATVTSPITGLPVTVDEAIAEAEKNIADAKNAIAELNSSESAAEVITALENALADAEARMKSDAADLAAAGAVVEALLEQMGLEPDDDDETGPLDGDDDDAVGPVEGEGGEG